MCSPCRAPDAEGWTVEFQVASPVLGEQTLANTNGGYCKLADPLRVWDTRTSGFTGLVTLSALTSHHATGTFSCAVAAPPGASYGAGANLRDGTFDVTY